MPARSGHGPIPATLGRYRILRRLGSGGMAEVFLARSTGAEGIEKTLVLKRVLPSVAKSARFVSMFVDEAKLAMRLNHPNIVQVYAFEQVRGELVLAMELVDGIDLARVLASARSARRRVPPGIAAYIVAEVARGLHYAHERRDGRGQPMEIVHRDVSPQNVLVSHDGGVKVADFGIARARSLSETTDGSIKGKFAYMAPEQARGEDVDRRTDVYAMGALLTELIAGEPPLGRRAGPEALGAIREGRVSLPRDLDAGVPAELDAIAERALAFQPDDRFATARDLARALTEYLHAQPDLVDGTVFEAWLAQTIERRSEAEEVGGGDTLERWVNEGRTTTYSPDAGELRERRSVVLVCGVLEMGAPVEALQRARRVLGDIAYKEDAVLTWPDAQGRGQVFQVLLGLGELGRSEPLRAIRVALDIVEALTALGDASPGLSGGIGVSRGVLATVRDASGVLLRHQAEDGVYALGETLAQAGSAGEVLTTGEVYRLARRDFAFDEQDVRDVALSIGEDVTPQGVRAYVVKRAHPGGQRRSVVQPPASSGSLVGRAAALRRLADSHAQVLDASRPDALWVVGVLGMGKTSLARAALAGLSPRPEALWLECAFGGARESGAVAWDLLHLACGVERQATSAQTLAGAQRMLGDSAPAGETEAHLAELGSLLQGALGPQAVPAFVGVLRALFAARSRDTSVVLGVDGVQWADPVSLQVLGALADVEGMAGHFCLWLISRPSPELDRALEHVPRLPLGELPESERRALVRRGFGGAFVPEEVQRAILARAGGNPFFIVELVDALLERGVLAVVGGSSPSQPPGVEAEPRRVVRRRAVPIALPATVEDVVRSRLQQLSGDALAALRWLSLCGGGLNARQLTDLSEVPSQEPLAELLGEGLVRREPAGGHAFANAVVRQVALDGIDLHDRARMQQRVDGWVARVRPYLAWVARARDVEAAGQPRDAADAFVRAGVEARAAGALDAALRYQAHALTLLGRSSPLRLTPHLERVHMLRDLARSGARREELAALRDLGERTGDPRLRAHAHAELARWELDAGDLRAANQALERARALWPQTQDPGLAPGLYALSAELCRRVRDLEGGLSFCAMALDAPIAQASRRGLAEASLARAALVLDAGDPQACTEAAARALAHAHSGRERQLEAVALGALASAREATGHYDDAESLWCASLAASRALASPSGVAYRLLRLAELQFARGDQSLAEHCLVRAHEASQALGDMSVGWEAWARRAEWAFSERRDSEALGYVAQLEAALTNSTDGRLLALRGLARARHALTTGDPEAAERFANEALRRALEVEEVGLQLLALSRRARALCTAGRPAQAREAAREAGHMLLDKGIHRRVEETGAELVEALRLAQLPQLAERCAGFARRWAQQCAEAFAASEQRRRYEQSAAVRRIRGEAE